MMPGRSVVLPIIFPGVLIVALLVAYFFGPSIVGAPDFQEPPSGDVPGIRVDINQMVEISNQIVQFFTAICFGLFVTVGYALSRRRRVNEPLSLVDVAAAVVFMLGAFASIYFAYQVRYSLFASMQHAFKTEDGLRQTMAWHNELHAMLALCIAITAIAAFYIVARAFFSDRPDLLPSLTVINSGSEAAGSKPCLGATAERNLADTLLAEEREQIKGEAS
jgi:hypothetical protein